MNGLIYLVGLIVVIMFVLSFLASIDRWQRWQTPCIPVTSALATMLGVTLCPILLERPENHCRHILPEVRPSPGTSYLQLVR